MAIAYQYDFSGYFVGEIEDYGGPLPNNSSRSKPTTKKGHVPRWNGQKWVQVEDHKGKTGYVNGEPFTIVEHGPLPEGWSETPPLPDLPEAKEQALEALKQFRQQVEYGGFVLNGQRWDSEQKDELRLNSAYKLFDAGLNSLMDCPHCGHGCYLTANGWFCRICRKIVR